MKNFKQRTLNICMAYLRTPNAKTRHMLKRCLVCWSKGNLEPYAYHIDNCKKFELDLSYTSDRMNSGRAKALLLGWKYNKEMI